MQIFISYAREDYQVAKRLFDSLKRIPGITPWLDKENLLPGMDWEYGIMVALEESRYIVIILSTNSVSKSGFVRREIKEALKRLDTFPPGSIFIIPARINDCVPNDSELKKLQWVDLFPDWDDGINKIARAIKYEQTKRSKSAKESIWAVTNILEHEFVPHYARLTKNEVLRRLTLDRDLAGLNLMDLDLQQLDLSEVNFQGTNLVAANLSGSDLSFANLKGANLERAELVRANVHGANLWGVNLWCANLKDIINLNSTASLEYTNFYRVEGFIQNQLSEIKLGNTISLSDYGSFLDFFRHVVGMSPDEIEAIFVWVKHEYFRSVLGRIF